MQCNVKRKRRGDNRILDFVATIMFIITFKISTQSERQRSCLATVTSPSFTCEICAVTVVVVRLNN